MQIKSETITIKDLMTLKNNHMLTVNPEYQRASVWTEVQQKKLIDSVLRSYPLPLFYFHHKVHIVAGMQSESLEIIDGQQRINALYRFCESALKLFDPIKDDKAAKFPSFIKDMQCPWARCDFLTLPQDIRERFLNTNVFIVKVTTDVEDEARDLFIRLQAGLPLNAQEKRDAWPGGFTELVLRLGGKSEIARYPGHDFFRHTVKKNTKDRGEVRQLCAQICMLFFEKAAQGNWIDIGTQEVDEYYYRNLGFDITKDGVSRFSKILDIAAQLFSGKTSPKLKSYEAIHIVLLLNALLDDYAKSWQGNFLTAYDNFKEQVALAKKDQAGEYWTEFGAWTQTASNAPRTIQRRHTFFTKKMLADLKPVLLDSTRIFGELEREIVYYSTGKKCAVCGETILWNDLEIHHIEEHQAGGKTDLDNAVPVHKDCHPKGKNAIEFKEKWLTRKNLSKSEIYTGTQDDESIGVEELEDVNQSNASSKKSKLPPEGTRCRFTYANIEYSGTIADGRMEMEGILGNFGSFTAASVKVTNTSRNGWKDWEVCLPGSDYWILADVWRKDSQ